MRGGVTVIWRGKGGQGSKMASKKLKILTGKLEDAVVDAIDGE